MSFPRVEIHPSDDRDFAFDFKAWEELKKDGRTISSATVAGDGLTAGTPTVSGTIVTCRLSGATAGKTYCVVVTATLDNSRDIAKTFKFFCPDCD